MNKIAILLIAIALLFHSNFVSAGPSFDENYSVQPPPVKNKPSVPLLKPIDKPTPKKIDLDTASREELIESFSNLSGVPFFITLKGLGIDSRADTELNPAADQLFDYTDESETSGISAAAYSVLYTTNAVSDAPTDVEPTTISITKGDRYSTTTYTTTAYIKNPTTAPRIHYSTTTNPANPGSFFKGQLPITGEYLYTADPLAAQNGYTRGGIAPGRQYIAGIMFRPGVNFGAPNSIAVWRADDGGYNWTLKEAVRNDNNLFFLDKPAIAVSEYPATRGYVYVAYVKHKRGEPDSTELRVIRSTDGGVSFHQVDKSDGGPLYTGKVNGAQILVNPFNGEVYVIGVDYNLKKIGMATAPYDNIPAWAGPEEIAAGGFLTNNEDDFLNGNLKAGTLPMARFNWVANKICLVWHEDVNPAPNSKDEPNDIDTDIFFTSKTPGPNTWLPKKRINIVTLRDQFMPALDFDSNGNMTVVFNDRQNDAGNIKYDVYMAKIDSNGNHIQNDKKISTFQTDPSTYLAQVGNFVGDYQDVWSWTFPNFGELYHSVWVGDNGTKDIFLSTSVRQFFALSSISY